MSRALPRIGILFFVAIMLVFALTVWAQAAQGQESTDTPAPVETVEMTPVPEAPPVVVVEPSPPAISYESVLLFLGAVIAGLIWFANAANKRVQNSVPLELAMTIAAALVQLTPTTTDDELLARLRQLIEPANPPAPPANITAIDPNAVG